MSLTANCPRLNVLTTRKVDPDSEVGEYEHELDLDLDLDPEVITGTADSQVSSHRASGCALREALPVRSAAGLRATRSSTDTVPPAVMKSGPLPQRWQSTPRQPLRDPRHRGPCRFAQGPDGV